MKRCLQKLKLSISPFTRRRCKAGGAVLVLGILTACGGGGGGQTVANGSTGAGPSPGEIATSTNYAGSRLIGQAVLVDVSGVSSTSMDVSWLPATTDPVLAAKIKYQIHAALESGFAPSSTTLKAEVMGSTASARVTGLQAAARYYVVVVAVDSEGKTTSSTPFSIAMPAADHQIVPGVAVTALSNQNISSIGNNQITLTSGAAANSMAVGQIVAGDQGNGFLSQVTSVNNVAGQTVAQTKPVAINEVVKDMTLSSTISLASLPATTATQAGIVVTPQIANGSAEEWNWPQSKFRKLGTPVQRTSSNAQVGMQVGVFNSGAVFDVSTKKADGGVGSWSKLTAPDTIGVLTETTAFVPINFDVIKDDTTYFNNTVIPIALCKVEITSQDSPSLVAVSGSLTPTSTQVVNGYTAIRNATQRIGINTHGLQARAEPYTATLTAYADEAANGCTDRALLPWKEKVTVKIKVVIVSAPNFPQSESKALKFEGGFTVDNKINFTFDPTLETEVKINDRRLNYARMEAKGRAALEQNLTITATGAATLDQTQKLISPRSFVKVYMVGSVPVVMSGEFSADLRVEGKVTGSMVAQEKLVLSLEDMVYGLTYNNGTWLPTKNVRPTYELKLSGDANAAANLTITLIPRLSIKFYDSLTGRLVIAPYLVADTGLHGKVLADFVPGAITTDADYWLTHGTLSGGASAWVMGDFTVFDHTFMKYPATVDMNNLADYSKFHEIPLIDKTLIAGLPILSAEWDSSSVHPADSRAYRIKGRYTEVPNPLQSKFNFGPNTFLPFSGWTRPKVIAPNNDGYEFVTSPAGSDPGDAWIAFTKPGTYVVRLGGHSSMGAWARQVAEVPVIITNSNMRTKPVVTPPETCVAPQVLQNGKCTNPTTSSNGSCGSANAVAVSNAPSINLCSIGTAGKVTGNGPWSWSCSGSNGGVPASCSATKLTTVPTITVTSASPGTLQRNVATTVTVSGTNLPSTAVFAISNVVCSGNYSRSSTAVSQTCTAQPGSPASVGLTVKDTTGGNFLVNGNQVIFFTVQ